MIEVFRGSYIEAMGGKNILENSEISVYVANEHMSIIQPSVSAGGNAPAILKVQEKDLDHAMEILDYFNRVKHNLDYKIYSISNSFVFRIIFFELQN